MDDLTRGKKMALRLLAARMYTAEEVADRLVRKGIGRMAAEEVVSELVSGGIIDDKYYAECYINDAVKIGRKGSYRIRQELLRKGLPKAVIDRAFDEADVDFYAALREYVSDKLSVTDISSRRDYERFRAMLARRGYTLDEIRSVLDEYEFDFE
ncbi:MAG TPA: recombination regulator RecX [Candidatus Monoglobus merdigallinarum]|uniref:Regulatory protein RecX n=1 Tax=Candidatus Monoglobus merdigallinarum TaxID=2838698 RepID=A0A9D1PRU0_9FIRM|nr:recombination regulator RecX [Candidatus Monoglobus merdigallinarum]